MVLRRAFFFLSSSSFCFSSFAACSIGRGPLGGENTLPGPYGAPVGRTRGGGGTIRLHDALFFFVERVAATTGATWSVSTTVPRRKGLVCSGDAPPSCAEWSPGHAQARTRSREIYRGYLGGDANRPGRDLGGTARTGVGPVRDGAAEISWPSNGAKGKEQRGFLRIKAGHRRDLDNAMIDAARKKKKTRGRAQQFLPSSFRNPRPGTSRARGTSPSRRDDQAFPARPCRG